MTAVRRRGAAAGIALASGLLLAAPAWADGQLTITPASPIRTAGKVDLVGTADKQEVGGLELRVVAPGSDPKAPPVVAARTGPADPSTVGDRKVEYVLQTAPCSLRPPCADGTTAPNGHWAVSFVETFAQAPDKELAKGAFDLDVPAQAPTRVAAALRPDRTVAVTWARGPEPDLLRWDVSDGGRSVTVTPAQGCNGDTCGATFTYPPTESGSRTYSVTATRACGVSGCTPSASPATSSNRVTFPPPGTSSPSATPGPSKPGASPGASAGVAPGPSPGGAAGNGIAGLLPRGFLGPVPSLGLPSLPTSADPPQVAGPRVAEPPLADGTYGPTLDYGQPGDEPEPGEPEAAPASGTSGLSRLRSTGGGLLGDARVLQSLAGGLVLVLGAAHLRTWVARAPVED